METDWEAVYRVWKQGLGWRNRKEMFIRCEVWLRGFQETVWKGREWGRTANYIVTPMPRRQENEMLGNQVDDLPMEDEEDEVIEGDGNDDAGAGNVPPYLIQFHWPT